MVMRVFIVFFIAVLLSCSQKDKGALFEKALGIPVPAGNAIIEEHRVINDEGLFSTYYAKLYSESDEAFFRLVNALEAKESASVRSLPLPAARGMNWWLASNKAPEFIVTKRYLAENSIRFVGIIRFDNYTYLWMQGKSVAH